MDSTRQNKIARLIQKELGDIFLKMTKETRGVLVSVSIVRVSPDLGIAKAYLSVFPSERGNEVVEHLNTNIKAIRFELGNKVRHQLRIIPEIKFYIDDSLDYIENIDKLLKE
jgi:ribosome-binding factor A